MSPLILDFCFIITLGYYIIVFEVFKCIKFDFVPLLVITFRHNEKINKICLLLTFACLLFDPMKYICLTAIWITNISFYGYSLRAHIQFHDPKMLYSNTRIANIFFTNWNVFESTPWWISRLGINHASLNCPCMSLGYIQPAANKQKGFPHYLCFRDQECLITLISCECRYA